MFDVFEKSGEMIGRGGGVVGKEEEERTREERRVLYILCHNERNSSFRYFCIGAQGMSRKRREEVQRGGAVCGADL